MEHLKRKTPGKPVARLKWGLNVYIQLEEQRYQEAHCEIPFQGAGNHISLAPALLNCYLNGQLSPNAEPKPP